MDYPKYRVMRQMILRCLDSRNKWGASHTSFERMLRKIPRNERGSKEAKNAFSDLVREGKILLKKSADELHVSLNPRLLAEIKAEELGNKL